MNYDNTLNDDSKPLDELKGVEKLTLEDIAAMDNVAEMLDKKELDIIGKKVYDEFEIDKKSMRDWLERAHEAMEVCLMQKGQRSPSWGADIHYPLISTAVMQFSARSVAEMSKAGKVAKYKVLGQDKDGLKALKGERIVQHLNYQIQEQMSNWFGERDKLHQQLAVVGTAFTKTYYSPIVKQNVSELIPYDQIIFNTGIKNLETAPRVSQLIYMTGNDIVENQRYGLFLDDYEPSKMVMDESDPEPIYHELIEQHTYLDLDKDGLKEPYVVIYHIAHKCVLRIVPRFEYLEERTIFLNDKKQVKRIIPQEFFTDYHFIPSPDGSFLSMGFGTLLLDTNHTINTILNQLINAGSLATLQGGFIGNDLRIKKEDLDIEPGTWVPVDNASGGAIKDSIVPLSYKEPSQVLLQLMDVLLKGANNLTSTSEVLTGTTDVTNASPNSVAMLMQQGLKVYSSIQRRIFRGFRKELQKLVKLNSRYLDPQEYLTLIDPDQKAMQTMFDSYGRLTDYILESLDIVPIVDIEDSTELEAMNKAQSITQMGLQFASMGATDPTILAINFYKAMGIENIDMLVPPPQPDKQDPKVELEQQKLQHAADSKAKELDIQQQELHIKAAKAEAEIAMTNATATNLLAQAAASKDNIQLAYIQQREDSLRAQAQLSMDGHSVQTDRLALKQKAAVDGGPKIDEIQADDNGVPAVAGQSADAIAASSSPPTNPGS